ncbi:MAG: carbamoyl-phosphate synthase subunit L, partial [Leptospiraceae bacterium]|nr:carbamoyl-phosphate synthase subunit L [Leptospiraceae bacterium]
MKAIQSEASGRSASEHRGTSSVGLRHRSGRLQKVLVVNRGEIARRFFFALKEEGIASVAVVTDPDREQTWYQFADQVVYIGNGRNYTDVRTILAAIESTGANAVYPGYGFLSEDYRFVESLDTYCKKNARDVLFMGPDAGIMRRVSNKLDARTLARKNGVPLFGGSDLLQNDDHAAEAAQEIGYPVIVKLDAGGGGKGMIAVHSPEDLRSALASARRIGQSTYGNADCYLERLIESPVHIEVQIFNGHAIGLRKCAVQRRNQKIVEETGDAFLDHHTILRLLAAAETMASVSGYRNGAGAGTVEFLFDARSGEFGFLEMNTRLQVEYPVTDQSLRIDLAKWQILNFDGREHEIPYEQAFALRFSRKEHAIECRIYAEDPWNEYAPAPGKITDLEWPTFNGIRCDFGFRKGDRILPDYDPMIGKLIARGNDRKEAMARLERALSELYVKGITTNVDQLLSIVRHPEFQSGNYTNRLLLDHPELQTAEETGNEIQACIFAAAAELVSSILDSMARAFEGNDLEDILSMRIQNSLPQGFRIEIGEAAYVIDLIQRSANNFHVSINGCSTGDLQIHCRQSAMDDFQIIRNGSSFPVRVDRRQNFHSIRVMEEDGCVRYYRLRLRALGGGEGRDPAGMLRSPFAGTFVQFANVGDRSLMVGDHLEKGAPLVTIGAMKMECVLRSPVSGRITYLLEDGNIDRLIKEKTTEGLVIGRSIAEGEVLAVVEFAQGEESELTQLPRSFLPSLYWSNGERFSDDAASIASALELLRGIYLGYAFDRRLVKRLQATFLENNADLKLDGSFQSYLEDILDIYVSHRQMFSPLMGVNQTWFGELNQLLRRWEDDTFAPSFRFRCVAARLLRHYEVTDVEQELRSDQKRSAFFAMIRAHECVHLMEHFLPFVLEQLKAGNLAAGSIRNIRLLHDTNEMQPEGVGPLLRSILAQTPKRSATIALEKEARGFEADCLDPEWPEYVTFAARSLLERYGKGSGLQRIKSSENRVAVFRSAQSSSSETNLCIAWMDSDPSTESPDVLESAEFAEAALSAARELRKINSGENFRVYLLGNAIAPDVLAAGSNRYESAKRMIRRLTIPFLSLPIESVIVYLTGKKEIRTGTDAYRITLLNGKPRLDPLFPEDPRHPRAFANAAQGPMLERGKWPPEIWARACLESDGDEIRIEGLDDGDRPVGARIYQGRMAGAPAIFYIKDSRIKGGATGNREGAKFLAALHLAYLRDYPFYVWNDGAGANIKEGMIALNRAAQGFYLNGLTASRCDYREYLRGCDAIQDPYIVDLLHSVEKQFELDRSSLPEGPLKFFSVAVGVGSSTGLDVYGSSQAPLQLMLDDRQSFRVLTGSNVIRSVTGEDLTNYEIGGAPVMAHRTGTVDIVAQDKADLIQKIRGIHRILHRNGISDRIERIPVEMETETEAKTERYPTIPLIRAQIDGGVLQEIKGDYQEGAALLAGICRLGGHPTMLMGPRNAAGIRSTAAVFKARDCLRTAQRLGLPVVFYFGDQWYRGTGTENAELLAARMDFLDTLHSLSVPRIHIVVTAGGLSRVSLNSAADAIVYVAGSGTPSELADFNCLNLKDAFDVAQRFIGFVHRKQTATLNNQGFHNVTEVELPDAARPFDMRPLVNSLLDSGSILELQKSTGDQKEKNLITALGRIAGRTIGILADQPLEGGAPDAPGTMRFRKFVQFLERHQIPLLMVSNAPGFLPGTNQERLRIQQIGGESLDVNVCGRIPVVSFTLNQNFGGRQIHAFSRQLRPGVVAIALQQSILAVMGGPAAFDLFHGKEYGDLMKSGRSEEAIELRKEFIAA